MRISRLKFCFFLGKNAHRLKPGFAAELAFLEITEYLVYTASPQQYTMNTEHSSLPSSHFPLSRNLSRVRDTSASVYRIILLYHGHLCARDGVHTRNRASEKRNRNE